MVALGGREVRAVVFALVLVVIGGGPKRRFGRVLARGDDEYSEDESRWKISRPYGRTRSTPAQVELCCGSVR